MPMQRHSCLQHPSPGMLRHAQVGRQAELGSSSRPLRQRQGDVCKASLCCSEMLSLAQPIGSACPAIDRAYTARLKHAM